MTCEVFLSPTDILQLTGYKRPGRQIAELRRQGFRFHVNAMGLPVVPRSAVEARISREGERTTLGERAMK